ncbi:hypothetical protein MBTS_02860 [Methylobacterium bullatum]|nr:hypothetical protein [Methylobacterium bullatum]
MVMSSMAGVEGTGSRPVSGLDRRMAAEPVWHRLIMGMRAGTLAARIAGHAGRWGEATALARGNGNHAGDRRPGRSRMSAVDEDRWMMHARIERLSRPWHLTP